MLGRQLSDSRLVECASLEPICERYRQELELGGNEGSAVFESEREEYRSPVSSTATLSTVGTSGSGSAHLCSRKWVNLSKVEQKI